MNALELRVIDQKMPTISFNYDEIKAELTKEMENYKGLIVTDQTLPIVKRDQKELAGLRIKIDNYRKEIKKEVKKPIDEFENKCKELIGIIEDAEAPIKAGLEYYEEVRRDEKFKWIKEMLITEYVESFGLFEPFNHVEFDQKWLNISVNEKQIRSDIENICINNKNSQETYIKNIEIITVEIDNLNKEFNLVNPIDVDDFSFEVGFNPFEMLAKIKDKIKAEQEKEQRLLQMQKEKEERLAREAAEREERIKAEAAAKEAALLAKIESDRILAEHEAALKLEKEKLAEADRQKQLERQMLIAEEMRIRNEFLEKQAAEQALKQMSQPKVTDDIDDDNLLYLMAIKNVKNRCDDAVWQEACQACYDAIAEIMGE